MARKTKTETVAILYDLYPAFGDRPETTLDRLEFRGKDAIARAEDYRWRHCVRDMHIRVERRPVSK